MSFFGWVWKRAKVGFTRFKPRSPWRSFGLLEATGLGPRGRAHPAGGSTTPSASTASGPCPASQDPWRDVQEQEEAAALVARLHRQDRRGYGDGAHRRRVDPRRRGRGGAAVAFDRRAHPDRPRRVACETRVSRRAHADRERGPASDAVGHRAAGSVARPPRATCMGAGRADAAHRSRKALRWGRCTPSRRR